MRLVPEESPRNLASELQRGYSCTFKGDDLTFSALLPPPFPIDQFSLRRIFPHKQYTILSPQLREGGPLDHALLVGWRFFEWTTEGLAGVRLLWVPDDPEQPTQFLYFNIGPYVLGSAVGFLAARSLEPQREYHFRVLALPQICVFAIWLRRAGDDKNSPLDALLPISPGEEGDEDSIIAPLVPLQTYSPENFFSIARAMLERRENQAPPQPE